MSKLSVTMYLEIPTEVYEDEMTDEEYVGEIFDFIDSEIHDVEGAHLTIVMSSRVP